MEADLNTPFLDLAELACDRVGGRAIAASDDFFAPRANLVKADAPIFVPGKFTSRGQWMDGWESRRRRTPGHDWCVLKLGARARIRGLNVNTAFFTGNFPTHCSIDALETTKAVGPTLAGRDGIPWQPLVPKTALRGDSDNFIRVKDDRAWTHLRLNIFPDGGVARLRVYGEVELDWKRFAASGKVFDLAAIQHGGLVLAASDMHYGAKDSIIMPGRARNMGEGWQTKRRRGPGHDWLILRLGVAGRVARIEIDTSHFKGNYPESASVDGTLAYVERPEDLAAAEWRTILPQTTLKPDFRHVFQKNLDDPGPYSHVRLNIFPDGGVSRLRIYGTVGGD